MSFDLHSKCPRQHRHSLLPVAARACAIEFDHATELSHTPRQALVQYEMRVVLEAHIRHPHYARLE